ncbi:uncharacterized protein A1O9_12901 [Exophiala aquamarina CBS 119918]|uniref:Telomere replication protein EST3 n=1 Tax=Exophiala aquamarina CBS 119918 TaxID=1182545 RepID=A0A072NTR4_9EURO|nr:uncharacterized protein A1O9_12901 [Exophiala aquamarina CBS 119918]KEF51051.1 hypothetical protein A1O9_12901 [Exophiala aquamarina CBS 119918]
MEHHLPWLAPFVRVALSKILDHHQGKPTSGFEIKALEDQSQVDIHRTAPYTICALVTEADPTLSQRRDLSRGTISDGKHAIDARFSTTAHQTLLSLERGNSSIFESVGLVKLLNPALRLNNRNAPTKLELLVESLETVTWRQLYDKPQSHGPVSRDPGVISLLNKYSVHHKASSQVDLQPNSSPQSIKSQYYLSPDRYGGLSDEAGTHASYESQLFLTQVPFPTGNFPSVNPTQDELYSLQLIQKLQNDTAEVKTERASSLDTTVEIDETSLRAGKTKDKGHLRRDDVGLESSEDVRSSSLAQPSSPIRFSQDIRPQRVESPVRPAAASGTSLPPTTNFLPTGETLAHPAHGLAGSSLSINGGQQEDTPGDSSLQLSSAFQKWRQELRQGRYLPQYIERISTPQRKLLESDEAWQPPCIGQRARPGDIPLGLLESLSKAADARRISGCASSSSGSESSHRHDLQHAVDEDLECHSQHSGHMSSSDLTVDEQHWPPSPSQQRRQFLPDDSPDPCIPKFNQHLAVQGHNGGAKTIAPISSTDSYFPAIASKAMSVTKNRSPSAKAFSQNTDKATLSAGSMPKSPQLSVDGPLEQGHLSPSVEQDDHASLLREDPTRSEIPCLPMIQNVKILQVARTPYVDKTTASRQTPSDTVLNETQITRVDNPLLMSSGRVPGTFADALWEENMGRTVISLVEPENLDPKPLNSDACSEIHRAVDKKDQQPRQEDNSFDIGDTTAGVDASDREISHSSLNHQSSCLPSGGYVAAPSNQNSHISVPLESLPDNGAAATPIPKVSALKHISASPIQTTEAATLSRRDPRLSSSPRATKTKRDLYDTGTNPPNKRRRVHSEEETEHRLPDPDYATVFQGLRLYRREKFGTFGRSTTARSLSRSRSQSFSPSIGDHIDAAGMQTLRLHQADRRTSHPSEEDSPPQSSTPLTGISDYGQGTAGNKDTKGCGVVAGSLRVPAYATLQNVFTRFRSLYSDYKGQLNDFNKAVRVLRRMIRTGNAPHPFLFDDVIFHHYHSYRPFLLNEVLGGEDVMTYGKFYNTHTSDPCHLQKVLTVQVLESLCDLDDTHDHMVQPATLQQINSRTVLAGHDHESVTQGLPERRTRPPQILRDETSPVSVKRTGGSELIQLPTRGPSPELGTPDVDRSKSNRHEVYVSVPSSPRTQAITVSRRSLPSSFAAPSGSGRPRSAQNRGSHALDSQASRSSARQPDRARSSPSTSSKSTTDRTGRRSLALNRATPKRIPEWPSTVVPVTREWWKDKDTPFKRFQKQHSALPSERRHTTAEEGGGINIFNWRT